MLHVIRERTQGSCINIVVVTFFVPPASRSAVEKFEELPRSQQTNRCSRRRLLATGRYKVDRSPSHSGCHNASQRTHPCHTWRPLDGSSWPLRQTQSLSLQQMRGRATLQLPSERRLYSGHMCHYRSLHLTMTSFASVATESSS